MPKRRPAPKTIAQPDAAGPQPAFLGARPCRRPRVTRGRAEALSASKHGPTASQRADLPYGPACGGGRAGRNAAHRGGRRRPRAARSLRPAQRARKAAQSRQVARRACRHPPRAPRGAPRSERPALPGSALRGDVARPRSRAAEGGAGSPAVLLALGAAGSLRAAFQLNGVPSCFLQG